MKPFYQIFDEINDAPTRAKKKEVIGKNHSTTLAKIFELAYHPGYQWKVKEMPHDYQFPQDIAEGITHANLNTELRRLYLFQQGNPTAEQLKPQRQKELLLQLLESLEPREAEVIMGIFNKDLGVNGLDYEFVKECYPNLLP